MALASPQRLVALFLALVLASPQLVVVCILALALASPQLLNDCLAMGSASLQLLFAWFVWHWL